MTAEDAFVEDIRENPDDDAPRLILADWLEDRGGSSDADRAEFIRVQCSRAGLQADTPEELRLRSQAEQLLRAHWDEWVRPLGRLIGSSPSEGWLTGRYHPEALYKFRRGFVYVLDMPARQFLDHAVEILRLAPLRQVRLHGAGAVAAELANCPQLQWLERIDFIDYFSDPLDGPGMSALAESPYLEALRGLGLYRNNLGDAGLIALANASWLPGLVVLELGENGLSARGVRALAATQHAFRPRRLLLGSNALGDEGVRSLADSPILSHLTTLSLTRCNLGPEAARALAASPHLAMLRYLHMDHNALEDAGASMLAQAPWMRHLEDFTSITARLARRAIACCAMRCGKDDASEKAFRSLLPCGNSAKRAKTFFGFSVAF